MYQIFFIFIILSISYYNNPNKKYKIWLNIFNWLLIYIPNIYFINKQSDKLTIKSIIFHIIMWNIMIEIYFYFTHRLSHINKFIYRNIHKVHHKDISNCVLDAQWVHPLETIFITIPTFWLWPYIWLFFGIISYELLIFFQIITFYFNITSHIYDGPHITHHKYVNTNFGELMILDKLMGTYKK